MKETQVTIENLDFVLSFPGGLQAELTYEDHKDHFSMADLNSANPQPQESTTCRGHLHLLGSALTLLTQAFDLVQEEVIDEQTIDLNSKDWWTRELGLVPFRELCDGNVIALEISSYDQWWLFHFELTAPDQVPELLTIGINTQTGEYLPDFMSIIKDYPLVEGGPQIDKPILGHLGIRESYYLACHAIERILAERQLPLVASVIHSVDCIMGSEQEQSSAQRDFAPFFVIRFVSLSTLYVPILTLPDKLQLHWPGPRAVKLADA